MSSDAIVLLKQDHRNVKRLFREFERSREDMARKSSIVAQIIEDLTVHTFVENEIMYPEVRRALPDLEDDVMESYEEHHVADVLCLELIDLDAANEHFNAKTAVLIENVRHHIDEEEQDWFPKVRAGMSRKDLLALGRRIEAQRLGAPRDPRDPRAMESARKAVTA
jgi:hemerythrin superfamily protein